jgi:hypothetical protein
MFAKNWLVRLPMGIPLLLSYGSNRLSPVTEMNRIPHAKYSSPLCGLLNQPGSKIINKKTPILNWFVNTSDKNNLKP